MKEKVEINQKRLAREQKTADFMIALYCGKMHRPDKSLCDECAALAQYAHKKLSQCPHNEHKPKCSRCKIHCYAPDKREQIRRVMRFAGPRMMLYRPWETVRHLMG
jgi:hypothetical protein